MNEAFIGRETSESLSQQQFACEVMAFGFYLPESLLQEQSALFSTTYITPEAFYDVISEHLDHCGQYYQHSQTIQNSEQRLEINQGLLLYASQLWYDAKDYTDCLKTLTVLRDDIIHSKDLQHLPFVAYAIATISDEYGQVRAYSQVSPTVA